MLDERIRGEEPAVEAVVLAGVDVGQAGGGVPGLVEEYAFRRPAADNSGRGAADAEGAALIRLGHTDEARTELDHAAPCGYERERTVLERKLADLGCPASGL